MPSKTAIAATTSIICVSIVCLTVLTWHGNDVSQLIAYLAAMIPSTVAGLLVIKNTESIKAAGDKRAETLARIESNTNGALTALVAKIPDNTVASISDQATSPEDEVKP